MSIQIEYFDKLYEILLDLELYIYLQGLVEFDLDGDSAVFDHGFTPVNRNAHSYLFERQLETVKRLDKLLKVENFMNCCYAT